MNQRMKEELAHTHAEKDPSGRLHEVAEAGMKAVVSLQPARQSTELEAACKKAENEAIKQQSLVDWLTEAEAARSDWQKQLHCSVEAEAARKQAEVARIRAEAEDVEVAYKTALSEVAQQLAAACKKAEARAAAVARSDLRNAPTAQDMEAQARVEAEAAPRHTPSSCRQAAFGHSQNPQNILTSGEPHGGNESGPGMDQDHPPMARSSANASMPYSELHSFTAEIDDSNLTPLPNCVDSGRLGLGDLVDGADDCQHEGWREHRARELDQLARSTNRLQGSLQKWQKSANCLPPRCCEQAARNNPHPSPPSREHATFDHSHKLHSTLTAGRMYDRDDRGRTMVHICAREGQFELAQQLLQSSADANAQDDAGNTALHCAVSQGFVDMVALLLANGAHAVVTNDIGHTPADIARALHPKSRLLSRLLNAAPSVSRKQSCPTISLRAASMPRRSSPLRSLSRPVLSSDQVAALQRTWGPNYYLFL